MYSIFGNLDRSPDDRRVIIELTIQCIESNQKHNLTPLYATSIWTWSLKLTFIFWRIQKTIFGIHSLNTISTYFIQNVELRSYFRGRSHLVLNFPFFETRNSIGWNNLIPRSPFPAAPQGLGLPIFLYFFFKLPLIFFVSFLFFGYSSFGVWPGLWPAYDWTWKNITSISESFKWRHEIKILKQKKEQ